MPRLDPSYPHKVTIPIEHLDEVRRERGLYPGKLVIVETGGPTFMVECECLAAASMLIIVYR
jgi:hypothetical protein